MPDKLLFASVSPVKAVLCAGTLERPLGCTLERPLRPNPSLNGSLAPPLGMVPACSIRHPYTYQLSSQAAITYGAGMEGICVASSPRYAKGLS